MSQLEALFLEKTARKATEQSTNPVLLERGATAVLTPKQESCSVSFRFWSWEDIDDETSGP